MGNESKFQMVLFTLNLLLPGQVLGAQQAGLHFETWDVTSKLRMANFLVMIQTRTGLQELSLEASSIWQLFANSAIAHLSSCGIPNCSTSRLHCSRI